MHVKSIAECSKLPFVSEIFILSIFERPFYTVVTSFVDHLCFFCLVFVMPNCACLFICALWSPAAKGLTSWLYFVVSNCEFVIFPLVSWVRCAWYLIVSIPDLCILTYFYYNHNFCLKYVLPA